jgi:HAE1 family hydrophobic/amphiphilic exporter-1
LGLTPNDITREISSILNGVGAWSINVDGEDRDIKIVYEQFIDEVSPTDIEQLTISTRIWPLVVWEVLEYSIDNGVGEIAREDTKILIRVDADVADGFNGQWPRMQSELVAWAQTYSFPDGISYDIAWEAQENADLIWAAVQGLFISTFVIFWILVLQFNSFSKPIIIMYSVICALLWVNIWLWATWNPYSMAFGIGFIALTWIVVNDAIILIDRINQNIAKKIDTAEAIIEAWRSRLQPIILTTLTTLLWVLPISLQDKFWEWLWFTMIFWLFAGSAMTLFVIPSLYHIVFVEEKWEKKPSLRKRVFTRKKKTAEHESPETQSNSTYTIE